MIDALLNRLREGLGMVAPDLTWRSGIAPGRDGYLPGTADELEAFNLTNALIEEIDQSPDKAIYNKKGTDFKNFAAFREMSPETRGINIPYLILRQRWIRGKTRRGYYWSSHLDFKNAPNDSVTQVLTFLTSELLKLSVTANGSLVQILVEGFRADHYRYGDSEGIGCDRAIGLLSSAYADGSVSDSNQKILIAFLCADTPSWLSTAQKSRLQKVVTGVKLVVYNEDPVGDAIWTYLHSLSEEQSLSWVDFLGKLQESGGAPSERAMKAINPLVDAIGRPEVEAKTLEWLKVGANTPINPDLNHPFLINQNSQLLTSLLAVIAPTASAQHLEASVRLLQKCFTKLPNVGCVSVATGNQIIRLLATMGKPGLDELGRLRPKLKNAPSPTLRLYEKLLSEAAQRQGITTEMLVDQLTPSFGLDATGSVEFVLGNVLATLSVHNCKLVSLSWLANGKTVKSVPSVVKNDYPEDIRNIKSQHKILQSTLISTRDRIDRYFAERREFTWTELRQAWFAHPLLSLFAERLIWQVEGLGPLRCNGTEWLDVDGRVMPSPSNSSAIELWHPVTATPETVRNWRSHFDARELQQPVKQVYREVYILTPAEENTSIYSNRMAGHILRQHQFNQLAKQRGWRYSLQGGFDNGNNGVAYKPIQGTDIVAQYYVEAIGVWGDDHEQHTTAAGIGLHLATDQVRFVRGVEPVPLTEVPAVVFSELMRDVDLFVGVSSIGNDPNWTDAGPNGRFTGYWAEYSFGELAPSAVSRRDLLERLLPRLAIAGRCSLSDRFLVVRGTRKTYKIHLGSGNILMSPNDQYLCIVPTRDPSLAYNKIFLPFDGDGIFSIILSKAFLLAEDDKITDPTILRQL
jgi:hypothetical protein